MTERFVFGEVVVEPAGRLVRIAGTQVPIGARAFDVLLALIERRNRVVTKNELLDTVWPGTVVEDSNVVVQVSTLRKLLGDKFIATVPGRGYRLVAAATVADDVPPPPPAMPATPAVPIPLSPTLLGRTSELTELARAMERSRLVTIIGAGGFGKTRLAQAYAAQHGAGWADLGALSDPELVAGTVARALGLPGAMGEALEGLRRGLQPSVGLVVLDSAEHLVEEVARVVCVLIEHAPGLKVLVTSQVSLGLKAENLLRLGPLAVPPPEADLATALTYGAVALFSERVHASDRHFSLDERNVEQAIGICRRLDGIPLAIELAAARMPMLGVSALERRWTTACDC